MTAHLTRHSKERGRERVGLNTKAMERLAARALEHGQAPADFSGSFRRYLDGQALKARSIIRLHGEFVYVFRDDPPTLITVIEIPTKYRRLLRRLRAKES